MNIKKRVLELLDCHENLSNFSYISKQYDIMESEISNLINVDVKYKFKESYVIGAITLGCKIDNYITEMFGKGEYMKGLLADALANEILFDIDNKTNKEIYEKCISNNLFISKRIDDIDDLAFLIQEEILDYMEIVQKNSMLSPLKSMTFAYAITDKKETDYKPCHSCKDCKYKCKRSLLQK